MAPRLRVYAHPTGPWLVTAAGRRFAVSPEVGSLLLSLDRSRPDRRQLAACLAPHPDSAPSSALVEKLIGALDPDPPIRRRWPWSFPLWIRLPLVPAPLVSAAAARAAPLAGSCHLILWCLAGAAGHVLAFTKPAPALAGVPPLPAVLVLFLLTALWHELGHAAALYRAGYRPGSLGVGLLIMVPVLYVEVTAVALLPRSGRLQVNSAGPCFQLAAGGAAHAAGRMLPLPAEAGGALTLAGLSALFAVVWSLWPFIRSDGYWLVCDGLGVENLDCPLVPGRSTVIRWAVLCYRAANAVVLAGMGLAMPWLLLRRFGGGAFAGIQAGLPSPLAAAALVLAAASLLGLWWMIGCRIAHLLRMNRRDLKDP